MRRLRWMSLIVPMVLLVLAAAPAAWAAPSGGGKGNNAAAKACQKGGWTSLIRSDGTAFTSQEACVSYAAKGGVLQPKPTATLTVTNRRIEAGIAFLSATGSGLLPGSNVTFTAHTLEGGTDVSFAGVVASDGSYTLIDAGIPCNYAQSASLSATSAFGGTITADASPGC